MSNADKYFYLTFDNNEVDFQWEDSVDNDFVLESGTAITAGTSYHICMAGDHSTTANPSSRLWVNGAQVAFSDVDSNTAANAVFTTLTIGNEPAPSFQSPQNKTGNFDGVIDNIMIWRLYLPTNSIVQLYNGGSGLDPTFAISNYLNAHRLALYHWFRMGDEPGDQISGVGAVVNDERGAEDLVPANFENGDFGQGIGTY